MSLRHNIKKILIIKNTNFETSRTFLRLINYDNEIWGIKLFPQVNCKFKLIISQTNGIPAMSHHIELRLCAHYICNS